MALSTILATGAGELIKALIKGITKKINSTKDSNRKIVLREIRENIKVLSHRNRGGITRRDLIKELSNQKIRNSIDVGFDFKKLRGRRPYNIPAAIIQADDKYLNWTPEKMINGIDEKISDLKRLRRLYGDRIETTNEINVTARLNNLNNQLVLLSTFINY